MTRELAALGMLVAFATTGSRSVAAQAVAQSGLGSPAVTSSMVPRSVPFTGQLTTTTGEARTGLAMLTFGLYVDQKEGTPIWTERQLVTLDKDGRYVVILGSVSADGLPLEAFATGAPKWLGVTVEAEAEQPRVMLLSVPYALKAADADTIGGRPASEFVVRANLFDTVKSTLKAEGYAPRPSNPTTSVPGVLAVFTDASNSVGNSNVVQNGSNIGINVSPAYPLHVFGATGGPFGYQTLRLDNAHAAGSSFTLGPTVQGAHTYSFLSTGPAASTGAGSFGVDDEGFGKWRLVIAPTGHVGIGTASPATDSQLDIRADPGVFHGVYSTSSQAGGAGVYGLVSGSSAAGVRGFAYTTGFATYGVSGVADGEFGVGVEGYHLATTGSNPGVSGVSYATDGRAVAGYASATTGNNFGVWGHSESVGGNGVLGEVTAANLNAYGVWGIAPAPGRAGVFSGNVVVTGALTAGVKPFKIDHPLDPENQYLYHVAVESPDMKNIYDGNVTTDARGSALVTLPDWFEALNRDFRYQLTVIGQFAQAIVAEKVTNNRFTIRTSLPNVEVSWQVTGIRQDAYANMHRIPVEELKPEAERGFYLHPDAFGQPEEKGVDWALRPEAMKRMKETRERAQGDKDRGIEGVARPDGVRIRNDNPR